MSEPKFKVGDSVWVIQCLQHSKVATEDKIVPGTVTVVHEDMPMRHYTVVGPRLDPVGVKQFEVVHEDFVHASEVDACDYAREVAGQSLAFAEEMREVAYKIADAIGWLRYDAIIRANKASVTTTSPGEKQ